MDILGVRLHPSSLPRGGQRPFVHGGQSGLRWATKLWTGKDQNISYGSPICDMITNFSTNQFSFSRNSFQIRTKTASKSTGAPSSCLWCPTSSWPSRSSSACRASLACSSSGACALRSPNSRSERAARALERVAADLRVP